MAAEPPGKRTRPNLKRTHLPMSGHCLDAEDRAGLVPVPEDNCASRFGSTFDDDVWRYMSLGARASLTSTPEYFGDVG